jgi:hypothetical protein
MFGNIASRSPVVDTPTKQGDGQKIINNNNQGDQREIKELKQRISNLEEESKKKEKEIYDLRHKVKALEKENITLKSASGKPQQQQQHSVNDLDLKEELRNLKSIIVALSTKMNIAPVNHIGTRIIDVSSEPAAEVVLGPITNLLNLPPCSFSESLNSIKDKITDLEQFLFNCEFFAEQLNDSVLTKDEAAAVRLYTMEWNPREESLYFKLNQALRERNRECLKPYLNYLRLLLKALLKLPRKPADTILWRGVSVNLSDQYIKSKMKIWWGISSTTLNMQALSNFLGDGEKTLFSIQTNWGVDIGKYSAFPSEEEVILFPCISFKVENKYSPSTGVFIIQLKEAYSPSKFISGFPTT